MPIDYLVDEDEFLDSYEKGQEECNMYVLQTKFHDAIKKSILSSYHDDYDNSYHSDIKFNDCFEFKQEFFTPNRSLDNIDFLELLFKNTEYVIYNNYTTHEYEYHDYRDSEIVNIFTPIIIVKLNQQFKNVYCLIKDMNLYVGCESCDGATSCSYEMSFANDWFTLFNFGMTEQERESFQFVEEYEENKMISLICNVPIGQVKIVRKMIPKFTYPGDIIFN